MDIASHGWSSSSFHHRISITEKLPPTEEKRRAIRAPVMSQHFVSAHSAPCPSEKYHSVVNVLTPKQPILIFDMFMFLSKPLNGNLIHLTSFCGNLGKSHSHPPDCLFSALGPSSPSKDLKAKGTIGKAKKMRKVPRRVAVEPHVIGRSRQVFSKEHDAD